MIVPKLAKKILVLSYLGRKFEIFIEGIEVLEWIFRWNQLAFGIAWISMTPIPQNIFLVPIYIKKCVCHFIFHVLL